MEGKAIMRIFICVNDEGKFYKIAWANESSRGIYLGMYGAASGTHFTYHADGVRHIRTVDSSIRQEQGKGTPISDITAVQQVHFQVFATSSDAIKSMASEYIKQDPKSSVSIFLNNDILGDNLAFSSFILHRDSELDFSNILHREPCGNFYRILSCNVFALTHFPDHKLALMILGQK
jgi:hypothetical protein